jgi:SAM-dependent methyltransferase
MKMTVSVRRMAHVLGFGRLRALLLEVSEWLVGVRTGGYLEIPSFIRGECSDAVRYTPTGYGVLPLILQYVGAEDVFVDLGCGKGRVILFLATRCRLRKIIGIEIVPELVQIARRNIAKLTLLTPVDIIEGDASKADLSEGTVYFMFNPFGEETLLRVLDSIERSLDARPRKIRILYHVPEWAKVLDQTTWLRPEGKANSSFRVWQNSSPVSCSTQS